MEVIMVDKWQTLLENLGLEIGTNLSLSPCNESEIVEFEQRTGITLPSEYKFFCQVFGPVSFGEEIFISCGDFDVEGSRNFFRRMLAGWREKGFYEEFEDLEREAFDRISDLVEYGFNFGGNPNGLSFWFDLRTYNLDKSCDIYYVSTCDEFALFKLPERNFFNFVRDYCLGTKLYDPSVIPERMIRSEQHQFFIIDQTGSG
jgi:hypothetical protein